MPAVDPPLRRMLLLPSRRAQNGFLSSSITLALILLGLLAIYVIFQRRSRSAERAHAARARSDLQQPTEGVHVLDGVAYRSSSFCWSPGARYSLMVIAFLIFAINIFSIVASALTEPIMREPKFWLVKVQAIPLATIVLFAQLIWKRPSIEAPAQINHTLILLLALILVVLAPVLTSIPVDSDHGRLSLARKILEHIVGPAALMGGLVAVHRIVYEQLDNEVSQPSSSAYSDEEGYLDDEEGYVYGDDSDDERLEVNGQEEDEGLVAEDYSGSLALPEHADAGRADGLADGEERADRLKVVETR